MPIAARSAQRTSPEPPAEIEALIERHVSDDDVKTALGWLTDSELATLVRRLPSGQREVLALRFLLDLDTDEITEITGKSAKAVRQLQSRALRSMEVWLSAISHTPVRRQRDVMLTRVRPAPIMAARRFALAYGRSTPLGSRNRW